MSKSLSFMVKFIAIMLLAVACSDLVTVCAEAFACGFCDTSSIKDACVGEVPGYEPIEGNSTSLFTCVLNGHAIYNCRKVIVFKLCSETDHCSGLRKGTYSPCIQAGGNAGCQ